ncbi:uncharacterized protein LOC117505823 [Thalassophryne amazonica]|uniref:uncharacterized protein LOC117505823 n=1 Tax=Thalassophryne amazonica TaxID=390379 RepID=UPI0014717C51|nr:uncharacterized protein LOC117505823 [Thalassophryne amazonica]
MDIKSIFSSNYKVLNRDTLKWRMQVQEKVANPGEMVEELLDCCKERLSLGDTSIQNLTESLSSLEQSKRKDLLYHSECRKPLVNKCVIKRLREGAKKRDRSNSPIGFFPALGRPSCSNAPNRPKRSKSLSKAEVCLFSSCSFCASEAKESLHQVFTDRMGETLLQIKLNTCDDHVRTCVSDLFDAGDAAAQEKFYHRNCLRSAQRTCLSEGHSNVPLIQSLCDEELLMFIQNTVVDDCDTINMAEVNEAYISLLKRYQIEVKGDENYRKHLKRLITERLPNFQFVKSLRKNEPDKLVTLKGVSKAIDVHLDSLDSCKTQSDKGDN